MPSTQSAVAQPFASRVQTLRASWIERRELQAVANSHDFASQLHMLRTVHRWATECSQDVADVYGNGDIATVSPPPSADVLAFTITVGSCQTATFSLVEHRGSGGIGWFVEARIDAVPGASAPIAVGPARRDGQWSRSRLEELVLSAVGAYERLRHDGDPQPTAHRRSSTIADFA